MAEPISAVGAVPQNIDIQNPISAVTQVKPENGTPFQVMFDAAVGGLQKVSAMENQANLSVMKYSNGQMGMDEVMMEMSKLSLAVELTTSIVNQCVTTFKEIQQMPF